MSDVSLKVEAAALWGFLALAASLGVAAVVAISSLVRSRHFVLWDALTLLLPVPVWIALSFTQLRPKSLSNLAEPIMLVPVVLVVFVLRTYALRNTSNKRRSVLALTASLGAAAMIYAFTPLLDE